MTRVELEALARRQHGVVARHQTRLSSSGWHRATTNGTLIALQRGVARLPGTAQTARQDMIAAVLAAGPGALVSHRSAGHLHGLVPMRPSQVDLIVATSQTAPQTRRSSQRTASRRGLTGVFAHRPTDRRRLDPVRVDGIPCTNVLRTLVDLGAVSPELVSGAVGHALTNDFTTFDAIAACLADHARPGRSGVGALRRALDDWALDAKPDDSILEPTVRLLAAAHGLPPVEFHPTIGGREVDFRVIGTPIVIECDGWGRCHRQRVQSDRNRRDDALFAAHGWIVVRFTYRAITTRPARVAGRIRSAIDQWVGPAGPHVA